MGPVLMASALAMSCKAGRTIPFLAEAAVPAGPIRLGSVADLSTLPTALRARAAALPVGTVRAGRRSVPGAVLGARARGLMPVLGCWLPPTADVGAIRLQVTSPPVAPSAALAALPWRQPAAVRRGDHLRLATVAGPVRVERDVEALQPARTGQRLFVRAADGKTLSVVYQAAAQ